MIQNIEKWAKTVTQDATDLSLDFVTLRKLLILFGPHPHIKNGGVIFDAPRALWSNVILSHYYKRKGRKCNLLRLPYLYAELKLGICFVSKKEKEILESENNCSFSKLHKDKAIDVALLKENKGAKLLSTFINKYVGSSYRHKSSKCSSAWKMSSLTRGQIP